MKNIAEIKTLEKKETKIQKDSEPTKFDITTLVPFESRVLVREMNCTWLPAIFGFHNKKDKVYPFCVVGGEWYTECIPYEGNEHLLGKEEDCDEFYKTWQL